MIELKVTGMTCGGCVNSVRKAIGRLYPTAQVEVDLASGRVTVEAVSPPVSVDRALVEQAVVKAGFAVEGS